MTHLSCVLCGDTSPNVRTGLIAWQQPIGRDVFTSAPRCTDKVACRARVEALGEAWEVMDRPLSTRELLEGDRS